MQKKANLVPTSEKVKYLILGMAVMLILTCLAGVFLVPALAAQGMRQLDANFNDIKIVIDGERITPKDATGKVVEPFIVDGTTYLPVRAMCEAIGYDVEWGATEWTAFVYSSQGLGNDEKS
jgi:Copper amine oxidase N-terminal domain.